MRTPMAGRSGPAGLACRLLLALALCACGGAGDAADSAAARDSADGPGGVPPAVQASLAAADTCTGPPPAFAQSVLNGPWQALLDSMTAHAVTFPDIPGNDDTTTVKLCRTCTTVPVEIRAGNLTPCLSPGDLNGAGQRILGLFVVLDTFPAQHGWDTLFPGDSLLAFANSTGGLATLVYDQGGSGKPSPSTAWRFWYCQDGASNPRTPRAQWRPRSGADHPGPGKGAEDEEDEEGGGTYGWMACASGCCQFYTPPPNQEGQFQTTPPQANENAPDTVGQGGVSQKPTWCRTS